MRVPKKRGTSGTNRQGRIILTNEEGNSFVVHVAAAFIWENADGRNQIRDIVHMLTAELELPKGDPEQEDNVVLALRSLEKKGLLEYIER